MKPRLGEEKIESGYMDNNCAYELLGWKPTVNLEDGLEKTIKFYEEMNIADNFKKF